MALIEIPVETFWDFGAGHGVGAGGNSTVYATARSTATGITATGSTNIVGQQLVSGTSYRVRRSGLKFDTSPLADATINQVNVKMSVFSKVASPDFDVQIVDHDWSSEDPITILNDDTFYDGSLAGTLSGVWQNTSAISTNTYYTSANLNTAWINKTGFTYFSVRSSRDFGNTAPTGNEYIKLDYTFNSPVLVVDYTPPSTITGLGSIVNINTITL